MKSLSIFTIALLLCSTAIGYAEPPAETQASAPVVPAEPEAIPPAPDQTLPTTTLPPSNPVSESSPKDGPPVATMPATMPPGKTDQPKGNGTHGNRPDHDKNRPPNGGPWRDDKWHSNRPRVVYYHSAPRIVYVYPPTYIAPPVYVETPSAYPDGYVATYQTGDYLPKNRQWLNLPDYAQYGLPKPRVGEEWIYNDRDVILISTATARIVSAITLAAAIR